MSLPPYILLDILKTCFFVVFLFICYSPYNPPPRKGNIKIKRREYNPVLYKGTVYTLNSWKPFFDPAFSFVI